MGFLTSYRFQRQIGIFKLGPLQGTLSYSQVKDERVKAQDFCDQL